MDSGLDRFVIPELGVTFSPFDLTVRTGEDVLGRIFSVALSGPDQGVCILMATGFVSGITLDHPDDDVNYQQGTLKILGLQGLYLPMKKGWAVSGRTKILAGVCDGSQRVIEGVVSGRLIATSTVEVSVGSFKMDFDKLQRWSSGVVFDAVPILENITDQMRKLYVNDPECAVANQPTKRRREIHHPSQWEQMCSNKPRRDPNKQNYKLDPIVFPSQPLRDPFHGLKHNYLLDPIVFPSQPLRDPFHGLKHNVLDPIVFPSQPLRDPFHGLKHNVLDPIVFPSQPLRDPNFDASKHNHKLDCLDFPLSATTRPQL